MPFRSPRTRSRSLARLLTIAVVGAVAVGAASPASAFALDAKHPTARLATSVSGWAGAPTKVRVGATYRALVLVSGERRTVRLERRVGTSWKVVDTDRTSRNGAAALRWTAPATAGRSVLRLHVLRTDDDRAVVTTRKTVAVHGVPSTGSATPAPSASSTPAPSATASTPSTDSAETLRAQLLTLVNTARATARSCGGTAYPAVPALTRSTALDTAAGDYALKMGKEGFFAHESPDGSTMTSRLKAVGIGNTSMRENIAAGQTSAASVMSAWLQSPGHCANIMARDVTRIGLGHATVHGSPYTQYWVQDFSG
jgi:uncharacterized protein YkwD